MISDVKKIYNPDGTTTIIPADVITLYEPTKITQEGTCTYEPFKYIRKDVVIELLKNGPDSWMDLCGYEQRIRMLGRLSFEEDEISETLGVSKRMVTETLKEELYNANSKTKIANNR